MKQYSRTKSEFKEINYIRKHKKHFLELATHCLIFFAPESSMSEFFLKIGQIT